jgi:hypothetical protein
MITNIPAIVIITLLTNLAEDIHPDGSRNAVVEDVVKQRVCHWVEDGNVCSITNVIRISPPKVRRFRRVWQPIEVTPPPLPGPLPLSPPTPPLLPGATIPVPSPGIMFTNLASNYTLELRKRQYTTNILTLVPGVTNTMILSPRFDNGSVVETNEYCRMFRVDFATETNWIYGLESSTNLVNWQPCPPEINGTGQPDYFFDIDEGNRSYRLVLREGVISEE